MAILLLKLLMFWLPVPVTLVMAYCWQRFTGSASITAFAVLLPLAYGYLMPFIGINLLKKWRFKHGLMIGGMYLHHGFMYASKLSLFGFLPLLLWGKETQGWAFGAAWVACCMLPYALTAMLQDRLSLRYGYVEFPGSGDGSVASEDAVLSYARVCFPLIGFCYSAGLAVAYNLWAAGTASPSVLLAVAAASFSALMIVPSLAYRAFTAPGKLH